MKIPFAFWGQSESELPIVVGLKVLSTGTDIAAGTGAQQLMNGIKGDNDSSGAGYMHLFNPASTTFVKHFIAGTNIMQDNTLCQTAYISGFVNTTSAINAVQFSVNSGELDDGTICLYGIS